MGAGGETPFALCSTRRPVAVVRSRLIVAENHESDPPSRIRAAGLRTPSGKLLAEVVTPGVRKRVEFDRASHAHDVVAVAGVQACEFGHANPLGIALQLDDRVACLYLAFAGDREVEAEQTSLEELEHELVAAHPDPQLEAGKAGLHDDELGGAAAEAVADADVVVDEALGGQVLA